MKKSVKKTSVFKTYQADMKKILRISTPHLHRVAVAARPVSLRWRLTCIDIDILHPWPHGKIPSLELPLVKCAWQMQCLLPLSTQMQHLPPKKLHLEVIKILSAAGKETPFQAVPPKRLRGCLAQASSRSLESYERISPPFKVDGACFPSTDFISDLHYISFLHTIWLYKYLLHILYIYIYLYAKILHKTTNLKKAAKNAKTPKKQNPWLRAQHLSQPQISSVQTW